MRTPRKSKREARPHTAKAERSTVAISAREAARIYGIPITSLRTLAALGQIKSFRYGPSLGRVRFVVDSIEEYIERHMRPYDDRLEQPQRRQLRVVR